MKKEVEDFSKETRIFVQTTSDVGNKRNSEYIENRISEGVYNLFDKYRDKVFSAGVILGMGIGLCISVVLYFFWEATI